MFLNLFLKQSVTDRAKKIINLLLDRGHLCWSLLNLTGISQKKNARIVICTRQKIGKIGCVCMKTIQRYLPFLGISSLDLAKLQTRVRLLLISRKRFPPAFLVIFPILKVIIFLNGDIMHRFFKSNFQVVSPLWAKTRPLLSTRDHDMTLGQVLFAGRHIFY